MTRLQIFDSQGKKSKEVTTDIFDSEIREDIVQKIAETEKEKQPYAPFLWAGMQTSASGNVRHSRHEWKSDRGKGVGRYPKKRMSDKGERFVWVAAAIPGVRGGRRAHPPKILRTDIKINQKERIKGLSSALAMIASPELVKKKYARLENSNITLKLPVVFESTINTIKSKEFFNTLKQTLGEDLFSVAIQKKEIRAGLGKKRNRRYKSNAGMLLVIGNKEERKISGVEVIKAQELRVIDLALNGPRLTAFTEQAIKDLEMKLNSSLKKKK